MIEALHSFGFLVPLLILVLSIICHEVAHGFAAYLHGDTTAYYAGRLTLNPLPHIDTFGSIILPLLSVLFTSYAVGYAKPVPYNPHNLSGKYAEFWVAAAGVLTNFFIAFVAVVVFKLLVAMGLSHEGLIEVFLLIIWTNISLGVFNLLPIPPFDGMSILQALFPKLKMTGNAIIHNPLYMIIILVVSVNIFSMLTPYISLFISFLLQ